MLDIMYIAGLIDLLKTIPGDYKISDLCYEQGDMRYEPLNNPIISVHDHNKSVSISLGVYLNKNSKECVKIKKLMQPT